ncbi:MAG: substrate-binding domain-containing protein [Coprobacter sp.]|nr:substrate-binding domain-containing protein [Coprobacter sp.]
MRLISFLATILGLTIAMVGCGEQKPKSSLPEETTTSGIITICVDETLMPIIQEEIELFEGLYPKANIIPRFTTETEAFNELFSDSVKLIVATRSLTEEEINAFKARKIFPKISKIATDGVALITNRSNPDSLVTMKQLHDIFTGKITNWKQLNKKSRMGELEVVFDNTASSTVRYVVENICKGDSLQGNIKARKDNEGVIEYVSQVPNAIGVIGSNWIGNDADSTNLSFDDRIQVMLISNDPLAFNGNSYQPFQAYIAMQLYPLCRDIYMICNSPRQSLAFGFASFVGSEKGQRIILKSGILPANVPMRVVNVRDNL